MISGPVMWLSGSAIAATAAGWIRYGLREEAVPGRAGPAILFSIALFLILAGFVLPPLRPAPTAPTPSIAILDVSASMELPGRPGGPTRLDSALVELQRLSPDRIVAFGTSVVDIVQPTEIDSLIRVADRRGSRLTAALRTARAAGADSVVVITDGELEDREDARREAQRLGLRVRELRVAMSVVRTTVREVSGPGRVSAGDTIAFAVEISTQASEGTTQISDSVTVAVAGPDGAARTVSVERPSPGRSRIAEVKVRAPDFRRESAWQKFEVVLDSGADLLSVARKRSAWVEVTRARAGVILVSTDPDWEARQLLPVLERASRDGATAYLRVGPDQWVQGGTVPRPIAGGRVRSDAAAADLLVVQGDLAELPAWLSDLAGRHGRVLVLTRGSGILPGSDVSVGQRLEGEWFADLPPPSGPVARALSGLVADDLPPVAALHSIQGAAAWPILELRRDRRGEALPAVVGIGSGRIRRVLVLAEGTWRWSARTGSARAVYRGLFAGVTGWLLEDFRRVPVTLAAGPVDGRASVAWSVAPGVEDLSIAIRDSTGIVVWTDSIGVPANRVLGPDLSAGDFESEARGRLDGTDFVVGRPFAIAGPTAEEGGRNIGASLTTSAQSSASPRTDRRKSVPLWPYAFAAGLLCAEWIWRHRLGLR